MVAKLKQKFIPIDYELDMLKKMQGLKQVGKSVQEYTKEFYQVLIRTSHAEDNKEKVAHYINKLRSSIQEELSLVQIMSIKEAYQFSLKVEEKLNKKYDNKNSGRGRSHGGRNDDKKSKDEAGSSSQNHRGNNSNHFHDQNNRN